MMTFSDRDCDHLSYALYRLREGVIFHLSFRAPKG